MAVVTTERRTAPDRAELRAALARLRLAEWREGVWVRPDNLDLELPDLATEHCSWVVADIDDDLRGLWDLDGWAKEARQLRRELATTDDLADGFVLSAAVLRHLAADPLLPPTLVPARWPGDELRAAYDEWDHAYRARLASWHLSR
jgi:phenylacetic acid degradation operon negative regulatory protein